jgi:hypothetical protein
VPTPHTLGQPRGDCPYENFTNHLGLLYYLNLYFRQVSFAPFATLRET